uniref:Kynureninase n=1 Tax=Streptosporangium sibiricum TaxID=457432 RepID=C0LTN1_STRSJ|nr:SibQ [Streptosporangium sibiricum]
MESTRGWAEKEASADPLAVFAKDFLIPEGTLALNGNSLGPPAAAVPIALSNAVRQWSEHLIRGWWDDGWWDAPERVGDRIGRLMGAGPGQVVVGESASVQLFNALTAAVRLVPERRVLIADAGNFPTDRYLAASVARLLGLRLVETSMNDLPGALARHAGQVGAVLCGAVDFRTGELWDVPGLTTAIHQAGGVSVWDLSHAAGAVPVQADAAGVDLAVGCGYKYLSGGPGAPAFLYAARRHHHALDFAVTGWHGHADPFAMSASFVPADGITRARTGTPQILSLLALEAALEPLEAAGMAAVRAKSLRLADYLFALVADLDSVEIVTPRDPHRRGNHVTLRLPDAVAVAESLARRGVIVDERPPDLLRICLNGLYISWTDVYDAVTHLREVLR